MNVVWTVHQPAPSDHYFASFAASKDGTKMLLGTDKRLYYYNGANWSEIQPAGDVNKYWGSCALSSDGSRMIACNTSRLWYYNGSSWVEQRPDGDGDRTCQSCSITADGTKMLCGIVNYRARLWYYNGSSWVEQRPAGDKDYDWSDVAISPDGSTMIASMANGVYIHNGSSWSEKFPTGTPGTFNTKYFRYPSMDYNGTIISMDNESAAGSYPYKHFKYQNSSWVVFQPNTSIDFYGRGSDISYDGTKIILGNASDKLFYYENGSFNDISIPDTFQDAWASAKISYDGSKVAVAGYYQGNALSLRVFTGIVSSSFIPKITMIL